MKTLFLAALATIISASVNAEIISNRIIADREVIQITPDNTAQPLDLIVSLHGLRGNKEFQSRFFDASDVVDEFATVMMIPDGIDNRWDFRLDPNSDDQNFIRSLIDQAKADFDIQKVTILGHSNGAIMAMNFACVNEVDAIVPIAGFNLFNAGEDCNKKDFDVFHLHGDDDGIVRIRLGVLSYAEMARLNNCQRDGNAVEVLPGVFETTLACENSNSSFIRLAGKNHVAPIEAGVVRVVMERL